MSANENRLPAQEPNLDILFNRDVRQFADTVRSEPLPNGASPYPTRGEINRQIMDATRPLLEQISELTRMVATLIEPRAQSEPVQGTSQNCTMRDEPRTREGNELPMNSQRSGSRSDSWI